MLVCLACLGGGLPSAIGTSAANLPDVTNATDLTTIPLEQLMDIEVPNVYSASKMEQKATQAPASITVITAQQIQRYGWRTLADVLQSVPGFNVSSDRNYAFLGARGVSLGDFNSRVLLLVNGHRVNNNLTDGGFIDTAFILDVDLIDRVEIIRGPGSVLYGNNAFFGVINVITRTGEQFDGAEVSNEYGSFDEYKARLTYGKVFTNGIHLLVSGSFYHSDGPASLFYREFNTPAQNHGVAENRDSDESGSLFASVRYKEFTLEGAFIHREKDNPTAQYYSTFNDPRLRTMDERSYAAMKFTHGFPSEVDLNARLYYDRNEYEIGYPIGDPVAVAFFQEHQVGEWWGAELQLDKRLWDRHTFTVGAEYRDDFNQSLELFDETAIYTDAQKTRHSLGLFGQGDIAVCTNLHLIGGVRYDQVGDFDASVNPRLAVIYNPFSKSTFKAVYGSAYRAPNFNELADPRFPDIEPETIDSFELIYEQGIGQRLRSSVSGYYNEMNDLIVFESGQFANLDANTRGLEFGLEGSWTNGIRARASYSLQETRDSVIAWDLPDSPTHLVKLHLNVPLVRDRLFAGVEFQYTSERRSLNNTTDPFGQPLTLQGETAGGFGIVNVNLFSQELIKNLEFSAGIYNVLDCRYSDPASRFHVQDLLERDGRTFRLKLTYRF